MKSYFAVLILAGFLLAQSSGTLPIRGFSPEQFRSEHDLESQAIALTDASHVRVYAKHIASQPHIAGSPQSKAVADYLLGLLKEWGLDAHIEDFESLMPYPTVRTLELVAPSHFTAQLKEPPVPGDPTSGQSNQIPTYNAYSGSGDVTASLVYVNYGVPADYDYLKQHGIDVRGKIVIARYGGGWRGVKPKVAKEHGAAACIIYSDPHEDGYFQGDVYPKGAYRPAQGVQRGSVVDMPLYPGDPLSPGWASEKGARKLSRSEAKSLVDLPVLPISWADAKPLLSALEGPVAPENWRGALPITYHIGPGPAKVHLKLDFDWTTKPLHDVIAVIPGSEFPDEWVVYGNHHDAWVNGASDPVSGAAALLETARALGGMLKKGWKPKRTIVLALWDGEEFGLLGSTEWAEKHAAELDQKLAVYMNSDSNGRGTLQVSGSHGLEQFMAEVARDVHDPDSGKSLLEAMKSRKDAEKGFHLGALGAGSDYVVFIDHLGISSLNLGFGGEGGGGVYHSVYDSFHWYTTFSDGSFAYGRALAQVMTVSLMRMADAPVLPYQFGALARTVRGYVEEIQKQAAKDSKTVDFRNVDAQLSKLEENSRAYEEALSAVESRLPKAQPAELAKLNETLYKTERTLLTEKGLPGRDWYRHELYAPGFYTGYGAKTLPAVREAVDAGRWDEANRETRPLAESLKAFNAQLERATRLLRTRL